MAEMANQLQPSVHLPRVEIKFCVQCKWNLRAAYYAQELLQTFSNTIGEIALVPVTGGIFTITLHHAPPPPAATPIPDETSTNPTQDSSSPDNETTAPPQSSNPATAAASITSTQIWDRKTDGGFPETKELKNRIRNLIDPQKDMGHIDRSLRKGQKADEGRDGAGGSEATKQAVDGDGDGHGPPSGTPRSENDQAKHVHGKYTNGEKLDETIPPADCVDCKLAAMEALEEEIGKVKGN